MPVMDICGRLLAGWSCNRAVLWSSQRHSLARAGRSTSQDPKHAGVIVVAEKFFEMTGCKKTALCCRRSSRPAGYRLDTR
eukprot:350891-Chlamydomonas_euryale.AAC.9